MVAVFGTGVLPGPMTYEVYCSLWLNLSRVRLQRAWDIKTGYLLATTKKSLPLAVYDAQVLVPEQASGMQKKSDRTRFITEQKSRLGW